MTLSYCKGSQEDIGTKNSKLTRDKVNF